MEEAVLKAHGDGETQLSIAYPEHWTESEGLLGSLVAFLGPVSDPSDFTPNFNVVLDTPEPPTSVDHVAEQHGASLAAALEDSRLLDTSITEVGGLGASRALVTYSLEGADLTLEQWIVPLGARNVVLSATATNADYAALAVDFADIVGSVSFDV